MDSESMLLLARVAAAGAAVIGPVVLAYIWLDNRFAKRSTVNESIGKVDEELRMHRGYFKDVFDKMEEHARRDEVIHREIMTTMAANHAEVLRELGQKADR